MSKIEQSIVAILNANGRICGTGFFATNTHILTCAHVITKAGGPNAHLSIHFHEQGVTQAAQVAFDGWFPDEDVALLQLQRTPAVAVSPPTLGKSAAAENHSFTTLGFPELGDYHGIRARGSIDGMVQKKDSRSMLQLNADNLAQGHSGAPLWDTDRQQVVGMIAEVFHPDDTTKHRDTAFAIPMETIWALMPALRPAEAVSNPFFTNGRINDPAHFFGRQRLLREIRSELHKRHNISVVGEPQIGKSSLLWYLHHTRADWLPDVPLLFLDLQRVLDEADLCEELLTALGQEGDTLRDLKRALLGQELVLLLDEGERLAEPDFNPRLHDLLRALAQEPHFALGIATRRPLVDIFPARTPGGVSPFHNIFTTKTLRPFTEAEARRFLATRLATTPIQFGDDDVAALLTDSGGHPGRLQRLAKKLFADQVNRSE